VSRRALLRKSATVNRDLVVLRHMFQKAREQGKAIDNPVTHHKPLRANHRHRRYLSHEEIDRLLAASDESPRPLLLVALHTGLRRSELFVLTWQEVDVKQGVRRVPQTKNRERREIPMTDTLRATLPQLPQRLRLCVPRQDGTRGWSVSGGASIRRYRKPALRALCLMIPAIR
jgi:integrase